VSVFDVAEVFARTAANFAATLLSAFGESPGWIRVVVLSQVIASFHAENLLGVSFSFFS